MKVSNNVIKYGLETGKELGQKVSEISETRNVSEPSKVASDCISNIQKGIIGAQKSFPKLRYSYACYYFGADSAEGIQKCLDNQMALTWFKTREQNIEEFPPIVLSKKINSIYYPQSVASNDLSNRIAKSMSSVKDKGVGRMSITDKLFGENGMDGTHTIGMIYHRGKYIFLDSIPESYPQIKDYHERLVKLLGLDSENVIFSNKPQQNPMEYTCNNWTHANIDAVLDYLKTGAEKELTPEVLDKILPEDINEVLNQQFMYVNEKLEGKTIGEHIVEFYKKKHSG